MVPIWCRMLILAERPLDDGALLSQRCVCVLSLFPAIVCLSYFMMLKRKE